MPYDMPMSLEEVLADEEARRAAAAYLGEVGAPQPAMAPQMPAPQAAQVAPDNFAALAQRYTEAQQRDAQQRRENALSQGAGNAAETILGGQGVRYARGPAPREPDESGGVLRDARAQVEIAKLGRPTGVAPGKAISNNPDSPDAKTLQDAVRARYPGVSEEELRAITPANFKEWRISLDAKSGEGVRRELAGASLDEQKARRRQDGYHFAKRFGLDYERFTQDKQEWIDELAAKEKEQATKAEKTADGQTVPAGEAASIGQSKAALNALDVLGKQFEASGASGVGGKASSLLPWDTDPVQYNDDVLAAAQAVGTILEGGKLAAGDEVKYRKMFPAAGDSLERGRNKLANVKRLVESLTGAKVEALDAAGYNVKRFKPQGQAPASSTKPTNSDTVSVTLNGAPKRVPRANLEALKKLAQEKRWTLEIPNG